MKKRILRAILSSVLVGILFISSLVVPVVAEDEDVGSGDFSVKISDNMNSELSYEAKVELYTKDKSKLDIEEIGCKVIDKDGVVKDESIRDVNELNFDNLKYGDEILITEIPYIDDSKSEVFASVEVVSSEDGYELNYDPGKEVMIEESKVSGVVVDIKEEVVKAEKEEKSEFDSITTETFLTLGGEYSLKYILNKYNIFSFNEIEGTHIIGPVIAQNKAYRTTGYKFGDTSDNAVILSDYSQGISSYIGVVDKKTWNEQARANLNYDYDSKVKNNSKFIPPIFYMSERDKIVELENNKYYLKDKNDNKRYKAPNNTGDNLVLQNDKFIDFIEAKDKILEESKKLLSKDSNIVIENIDEKTGYLKIEAGYNYIINDASNLRIVDIQYPPGYDPIENPYEKSTIINVLGSELVSSGKTFDSVTPDGQINAIKGETYPRIKARGQSEAEEHYFFPRILINGENFNGTKSEAGGEYGEKNSIVWNFPNIKTNESENRVVTKWKHGGEIGGDILGHIVAPQAEFWNYIFNTEGNVDWNGGNNNGCAIVKSWHGGDMESHMWPYGEGEIGEPVDSVVDLSISGKKKFEGGNLSDNKFEFILEMYDGGKVPEGILGSNVPQIITQNNNGEINFKQITFNKIGTYVFRIKEVVPTYENKEGIIYDESQYKIEVSIDEDKSNNKLVVSSTKIRKEDKNGNELMSDKHNEIVFNNKKEEKLSTSIEFKAKKEFIGGDLSKDKFQFNLLMFDEESVEGTVIQTVEQKGDGSINFEPITFTKEGIYKFRITEVIPSDDTDGIIYDKSKYDIEVIVTEKDGKLVTSTKVTNVDGEEVEDILFINKKSDEVLPEAGGEGNRKYILGGMFMMITSMIFLKRKIEE